MVNSIKKKLEKLKDKLNSLWFSSYLPRISNFHLLLWPMNYSSNIENMASVQSSRWYNEQFYTLQSKTNFLSKDFDNEVVRMFANGSFNTPCSSAPSFRQAASLISNGFTSSTMLGKLRATNLNLNAAKNRVNSFINSQNIDLTKSLQKIAAVCLSEPVCSVEQFSTLLKFEIFARNPVLLENEVKGKDVFAYDKLSNFSPSSIADKLYLKRQPISKQTFEDAISAIGKKLGISMYENKSLNGGAVQIYPCKRFAPRHAIRKFNDWLLRREPKAISKGLYQLEYPSLGSNSVSKDADMMRLEQLYTIIKALASKSVENYINRTRGAILNAEAMERKVDNLPSSKDFTNNETNIRKATACLIASDISLMVLGNSDLKAAKLMRECFKIEAGQNIGQFFGDTQDKFMPFIADYYAKSIKSFANDFGVDVYEYAKAKGVELADGQNNIEDALYAFEKVNSQQLFGEVKPAEEVLTSNKATSEAIKNDIIKKLQQASRVGQKLSDTVYTKELSDMIRETIVSDDSKAASKTKEPGKQYLSDFNFVPLPTNEVNQAFEDYKEYSEPEPQKAVDKDLVLSSMIKTQFKKVNKDGELVPLDKSDSLSLNFIQNELGQTEEQVLLNGKKVESRVCDLDIDFTNPDYKSDAPQDTVYSRHVFETLDIQTPNGILLIQKDTTPTSSHGYSICKDEEHWIYNFASDVDKGLKNDFVTTPDSKYFVNGRECSQDDFIKLQDFCSIQANRKDITASQVIADRDSLHHFKDGVLMTKDAEISETPVLMAGVYCSPDQERLCKNYCVYEDVKTPMLAPFYVAYQKPEKEIAEVKEINKNQSIVVSTPQALKWFRCMGPDGKLIPLRAGSKLTLTQTENGFETSTRGGKFDLFKCPKYDLYSGREVYIPGVYTVDGIAVDFTNSSLSIETSNFSTQAGLTKEYENSKYWQTGDELSYVKGIAYVNGERVSLNDYRLIRALLDTHSNYKLFQIESDGSEHVWFNDVDGHPVTLYAKDKAKKYNFDGVFCSEIECDLYKRYGIDTNIKQSLSNKKDSRELSVDVLEEYIINDVKVELDRAIISKIAEANKKASGFGSKTVARKKELLTIDLLEDMLNRKDTSNLDKTNVIDEIKRGLFLAKEREQSKIADEFVSKLDINNSKYAGMDEKMVAESILYMPVNDTPKIYTIVEESVDRLLNKYKPEYLAAREREEILQRFNERKDFEIKGVTGEELAEFWKTVDELENSVEKSTMSRAEFLSKLNAGVLPQATQDRALEKVQSLSIPWFNSVLATLLNDYVDKRLVPAKNKNLKDCKNGKILFGDYEDRAIDLIAQERLARNVSDMLIHPLSLDERENNPGFEIEKAVWDEVRNWTNGLAKSVIEFYNSNKAVYQKHDKYLEKDRITVDICKDYVQKVGGVRKLKAHIMPNIEEIFNDTERNKTYAKVVGINSRNIVEQGSLINEEKENDYGKSDFTK